MRRCASCRSGVLCYLLPHLRDPLWRRKIEHHLVGELGRDLCHRRAERADTDAGVRQRMAQSKFMTAYVAPVIVGTLAPQDRPQAVDGFAHARRTVRPLAVVPAADDDWAGCAQSDVDLTAGERGN